MLGLHFAFLEGTDIGYTQAISLREQAVLEPQNALQKVALTSAGSGRVVILKSSHSSTPWPGNT